jgi:hypothetical protein
MGEMAPIQSGIRIPTATRMAASYRPVINKDPMA